MPRHILTPADHRKGGQMVASQAGGACPRCSQEFPTHAKLAGHLSLHTWADQYTQGDLEQARHLFSQTGAAASDPCPWNGAYAEGWNMLKRFGHEQPQPPTQAELDMPF